MLTIYYLFIQYIVVICVKENVSCVLLEWEKFGTLLCGVLFHPLPVNMVGLAGCLSRPTSVLWVVVLGGHLCYRLVVFIYIPCAVN